MSFRFFCFVLFVSFVSSATIYMLAYLLTHNPFYCSAIINKFFFKGEIKMQLDGEVQEKEAKIEALKLYKAELQAELHDHKTNFRDKRWVSPVGVCAFAYPFSANDQIYICIYILYVYVYICIYICVYVVILYICICSNIYMYVFVVMYIYV